MLGTTIHTYFRDFFLKFLNGGGGGRVTSKSKVFVVDFGGQSVSWPNPKKSLHSFELFGKVLNEITAKLSEN